MNAMTLRCLSILAIALAMPALAEVAVYEFAPNNSDDDPRTITIVRSIIDDGDPFVWNTLGSPHPGLHVLNADGATLGDGRPSILHELGGDPIVVWERSGDIVLSRFADGAWTPPATVVSGPDVESDPVIVRDGAGLYHVVYAVDGAEPSIHTRSSTDLTTWSVAERLSPVGIAATRPSATIHEGLLRVGYELHIAGLGAAPREIELATVDPVAGISRELVTTTWELDPVHLSLRCGAGRLWIEWREGLYDLVWSRLEVGGGWSSPSVEPSASVAERDYDAPGRIRSDAATLP